MQHLLLAVAIVLLTIIATHERNQQKDVKVTHAIEIPRLEAVEPLPETEVEDEFMTRHVLFDMYGI